MLKEIIARVKEGYQTSGFPETEPALPDRFCGRPIIDFNKCPASCHLCSDVCPTSAIVGTADGLCLDMGKCLFCGECANVCPHGAISFTREYRLSAWDRNDLIIKASSIASKKRPENRIFRLFHSSLKLRQVSAGGCNACEADSNVLNTLAWDLGQFGIQFVASPRHADCLLITGPVSLNMALALEKTYKALPQPRIVIAVGACAISGGLFAQHPETRAGAMDIVPVDLFIPGCPPHPATILDGLLRITGRINDNKSRTGDN